MVAQDIPARVLAVSGYGFHTPAGKKAGRSPALAQPVFCLLPTFAVTSIGVKKAASVGGCHCYGSLNQKCIRISSSLIGFLMNSISVSMLRLSIGAGRKNLSLPERTGKAIGVRIPHFFCDLFDRVVSIN